MTDQLEPGCYVDGHWGQYASGRLCEIALDLGWSPDASDPEWPADRQIAVIRKVLASIGPSNIDATDEEHELVIELADEALTWLNDNACPAGLSWDWHEGEIFLQSTAWWEESC